MSFSSLVLATDGSEHAAKAAGLAGEMSSQFGAPVHVVNVVRSAAVYVPVPEIGFVQSGQIMLEHRDRLMLAGRESVERAASVVRERGGTVGSVEVVVGDPANEIVAFANRANADCIVMGRRGLGNVSGLFAGSVTHKVAHIASTTVMTTA